MKNKIAVKSLLPALVLAWVIGCGNNTVTDSSGGTQAAGTGSSGATPSEGATDASAARAVPQEVKDLLTKQCATPPTGTTIDTFVNNQHIVYQDKVVAEDEGDLITDGKKLFAKNLNGVLYIEPSGDNKVYWGARKWTFAKDEETAKKNQKNISITSKTVTDEGQVVVSHPDSTFSSYNIINNALVFNSHGEGYQVCLVLKAPAEFVQRLEQDSGILTSMDHNNDLAINENSGDLTIKGHKNGNLSLNKGSGVSTVEKTGSGSLTLKQDSGTRELSVNTSTALNINSGSGDTILKFLDAGSLQKDGLMTKNSGTIEIITNGVGFKLDATTQSGAIDAPIATELPQKNNVGDIILFTNINNGGATLKITSGSGVITIN